MKILGYDHKLINKLDFISLSKKHAKTQLDTDIEHFIFFTSPTIQ